MTVPRVPAVPVPDPAGNGCHHDGTPGHFDERARRLAHEELAVARRLAAEGHDVSSLPCRPGQGRTADLEVCGRPVEVKSFSALTERPGGPPTAASVCNKLLRASRQADVAVVWAAGSGLDEREARRGLDLFAARGGWAQMASARVLGDGFDLGWAGPTPQVAPVVARPAPVTRRARHRGLGL
ncbi:MAG: hypothetical protein ACRDY0_01370 [Acidimicrobiales bacterium]